MRNRIHKVLIDIFPSTNGQIDDNWGPNEIEEWDSLTHLNLVMALSEEFNISLEFEEVLSIEKIGDIYPLIEKRGIE